MKKKPTDTNPSTPDSDAVATPTPKPARVRAARPRRVSAPVKATRAPSDAPSSAEVDVAATLAEVEARAAAAHARELAEAEAEAAAESVAKPEPKSAVAIARASQPDIRRAALSIGDEDDEEDEDDLYDDRWDDDAYAQHRGPRRSLRERARSHAGLVELLMFRVGNERFAVELLCVEEAIDLVEPHHVPEMPPAMLGVITVRDTLTPVFSPDDALGVAAVSKGAALIFRSNRGRFALAIDDVDDVTTLDLTQLRDAPGIDGSDSLVLGVARNGSGIVALVDAEALIAACQATPIPELA
ncbi:MAG: chemotaxis protein CheW [Gemmatimonadaceae bacterium]